MRWHGTMIRWMPRYCPRSGKRVGPLDLRAPIRDGSIAPAVHGFLFKKWDRSDCWWRCWQALLVELTVFPVVHVLVAQASPSHRMGFGFGLLGLSESIGAVAGVMLGTYLYSRAQHAEALGDYWLTFGIVCTAVVCMGALWGLISAGNAMIKSPKLDHTTSAP